MKVETIVEVSMNSMKMEVEEQFLTINHTYMS